MILTALNTILNEVSILLYMTYFYFPNLPAHKKSLLVENAYFLVLTIALVYYIKATERKSKKSKFQQAS